LPRCCRIERTAEGGDAQDRAIVSDIAGQDIGVVEDARLTPPDDNWR
jgi:hypothetical protein